MLTKAAHASVTTWQSKRGRPHSPHVQPLTLAPHADTVRHVRLVSMSRALSPAAPAFPTAPPMPDCHTQTQRHPIIVSLQSVLCAHFSVARYPLLNDLYIVLLPRRVETGTAAETVLDLCLCLSGAPHDPPSRTPPHSLSQN